MPYIIPERRMMLHYVSPGTPGELNYMITQLLLKYLGTQGMSYQTINDILGAVEGAKMEFYRRIAVPYEDTKIEENGDVYP